MMAAGLGLTAMGMVAANAADVTLVADGKPNAVIVVPPDPPPPPPPTNPKAKVPPVEKSKWLRAAEAIQTCVEKMSGAKLPIVTEGQPDASGMKVKIAVGYTKLAADNGIKVPSGFKEVVGDPKAFEEEGFVIKTKGDLIVVGGNSDGPYQGTLYAAYEFLERLGCRWYFPGEWGEVVPEKKTVTFPETDLASRPDFPLRNVSIGGWIPSTKEEKAQYNEWAIKIKWSEYGGPGDKFYPNVGDGFLAFLLDPNEYFPARPEYYALNKNGSSSVPKKGNRYFENGTMLNLSNPEVFAESVKNLRAAFAGEKKMSIVAANGFGISPPDATATDYRPESVALSQNFDYPAYVHDPMNSEQFFGFAAKLAKEFPDKWVSTMAYSTREMPPQGLTLPPNVRVNYAPISSCVLHPGDDPKCWRRQESMGILKQWCKLSPHVDMYDYNPGFLLGSFVPERDVANFAVNAKLYKATGMKGIRAEGRKAFMQTWISYYVRGKLMWDVTADAEAIKKDFYTTFFGSEAGPHVQAWWDECEKALAATTMHCHEDWLVNHVYTVPFTKKLHELVEKASKCNMTPKQKERFEAFALIADHLEAFAAMEEAEMKLDYAEAAKQAQRCEDDKLKLIKAYSFFMGDVKNGEFTNGRMTAYTNLAARTKGEAGTMVAPVPLEAKFQRDRFNEGVVAEWYLPAFDDGKWGTKNTFLTWDAQDQPEDDKGHDYDGYGWYRFTVDVPGGMVDKPLRLHLGGVINEGWVWINGEYAGHRPWYLWWSGRKRHEMDVNVTGKVKAGKNVIAVRVWNNAEIGGLYRRGFLWAPTPETLKAEQAAAEAKKAEAEKKAQEAKASKDAGK
jgi:hypothetical protein